MEALGGDILNLCLGLDTYLWNVSAIVRTRVIGVVQTVLAFDLGNMKLRVIISAVIQSLLKLSKAF